MLLLLLPPPSLFLCALLPLTLVVVLLPLLLQARAAMRADEEERAARLAWETQHELDREEATRLQAKNALRKYLAANEENKAVRQLEKERGWAEDAHYQKAWEAVLDKQEKERTDRWAAQGS